MNAHPYVKAPPDPPFRSLRQFNCPEGLAVVGLRERMRAKFEPWFSSETMVDRFGRALARHHAIDLKEFCEAFEFFYRARKRFRSTVVADLCCGHGLTGLLFAIFERRVERVLLVDRSRPQSFDRILAATLEVAPWVASKIEFVEASIERVSLPPGTMVVAVHACGHRTDRCINAAVRVGGPLAVMPCCYSSRTYSDRPLAFTDAIGRELAVDIDRTYGLEAQGYTVHWTAIPRAVTVMNRILIARPGRPL